MPAAWAVSTMPVPFGTVTSRSSIVSGTRSGPGVLIPPRFRDTRVPGTVPRPWRFESCPGDSPSAVARGDMSQGQSLGHVCNGLGSRGHLGGRVVAVLVDRREDAVERR